MSCKNLLFQILLVSAFLYPVASQSVTSPLLFNNHYYGATLECMTWVQADTFAAGKWFLNPRTNTMLQGHLVTITTPEEQAFVYHTFVGQEWTHGWIGAYRILDTDGPAANWAWVTGEPWSYTNWAPTEPDRIDEHRGSIMNWTGGTWHDYGEESYECGLRYTIVEFEPPIMRSSEFDRPITDGLLRIEKNRSVPVKVSLVDLHGNPVTHDKIKVPPILAVYGSANIEGGNKDVTLVNMITMQPSGSRWMAVLSIKNPAFAAYRIMIQSGNPDEYTVLPSQGAILEIGSGPAVNPGLGKIAGSIGRDALTANSSSSVAIYTADGRLVRSFERVGGTQALLASGKSRLPSGSYVALIRSIGGERRELFVVK